MGWEPVVRLRNMPDLVRHGARAVWNYALAIFSVLGGVSLVVWVVAVASSPHHHPLNFWLVVGLGLLLIAALVWGARRGKPSDGGVHIHMEGGDIIYQVAPGQLPSGAPKSPSTAIDNDDAQAP